MRATTPMAWQRRTPAQATPYQREFIKQLLRRRSLDTAHATLFHAAFWQTARLSVPEPGADIDVALWRLRPDEASRLIDALKEAE